LKSFFVPLTTAIRFLTVLPLTWRAADDAKNFSTSLTFFPLVGVLIGSIGYILATIVSIFLPISVVAVSMVCFLAFISGCLHLDGLADSSDGLLSSRPREKALVIMKDSRTGAMGVVAVVFVLLGKYAALSSMDTEMLPLTVFFMPLIGRCAIVFVMAVQQYARKEGGLATLFYSGKSKKAAVVAMFCMLLALAFLAPNALVIVPVTIFFVIFLFVRLCNAKLGGATGDTLGATCEIAELLTACCFAALV